MSKNPIKTDTRDHINELIFRSDDINKIREA